MMCRFCGHALRHVFVDLGSAPPSNCFLSEEQLNKPEVFFPLKVFICEVCFLVQIDEFRTSTELFGEDYAYFSSMSETWLRHSRNYVDSIVPRLGLDPSSLVVEVASNDGYLLQYFRERGIPCLGIEPTHSTAEAAKKKGIEVVEEFFGIPLANRLTASGRQADLIVGNNVLAHVPDVHDFVGGLQRLLKLRGTITMEFPHLLRLVENAQFDTIYHEHFSYFSLSVVDRIFRAQGLTIHDVEEVATHGGSLRIFASHAVARMKRQAAVEQVLEMERRSGLESVDFCRTFQGCVIAAKNDFVAFLIDARRQGKRTAAYGAAAKGNTLLNYSGIRADLIEYVVDKADSKKGKYLPGSRIPVVGEELLKETRPDFIVILPWNLKDEIEKQLAYARAWNASFVTAIPHLTIF